jgi:dUTP pyrophosphatase
MKTRGFENVNNIKGGIIPVRGTKLSAGYDFSTLKEEIINPGETVLIETGIKAYMLDDEVLKIYVRSSLGFKKNLRLANSVGIIDADYYSNENNDGHIMIPLHNFGKESQTLLKNERIAQGIFTKYLTVDEEEITEVERNGGFGSTKH